MKISRKALATSMETVGERQVRVRVSTDQPDRVGDIVVQKGIDLAGFRQVRTILWNHDQGHPIATCPEIDASEHGLEALAEFPAAGISQKADEIYGLIKAGIINAASIGFLPLDTEPVDGKRASKGLRINRSELLEFSFVSVPANPGALVVERAMPGNRKALTLKGLYGVAQLAYVLDQLGDVTDMATFEREREGDSSEVPEMLAAALRQVGAALVAMTAEEVAEMLADAPEATAILEEVDKAAPFARLVAKALRATKSGRAISAGNEATLRDACKGIMTGHDMILGLVGEGDDPGDDAAEKRLREARERRRKDIEALARRA